MNITYLVGNGLDLQYGLATKYVEFYKHQYEIYKSRKAKEGYVNRIYESLFADKINDYTNWSDFELSIGKLTKERTELLVTDEDRYKFIDDFLTVNDDLREYLTGIQDTFDVNGKGIDFKATLINLMNDLPNQNRTTVEEKCSTFGSEYDYVRLLTFNYTNVIDRLYEESVVQFDNPVRDIGWRMTVKQPIHAHGMLNSGMVLGLSDDSQISDRFTKSQKEDLLKELILYEFRENWDVRNREIINLSDIIVIYGMSIGDTDKYVWNMIAKHSVNENIPILIYHYEERFDSGTAQRKKRKYREIENKFIQNSGIDKELEEKLRGNLIPIIGKTIFQISE